RAFTRAMSPPPHDVKERLRRRAVEILVVLALVFLGVRIALPRFEGRAVLEREARVLNVLEAIHAGEGEAAAADGRMIGLRELVDASDPDRKSTRLNSSHVKISYAVFC